MDTSSPGDRPFVLSIPSDATKAFLAIGQAPPLSQCQPKHPPCTFHLSVPSPGEESSLDLVPWCSRPEWVSGNSGRLPSVHSRQWLEDALRENEAGSCFIFLVGTKKDLLVSSARGLGGPQENAYTFSSSLRSGGWH